MKLKIEVHSLIGILLVLLVLISISPERASADIPGDSAADCYNVNKTSADQMDTEQRIVEDMLGRRVELPVEVNRIVTSYKTATQFIFALGAEERLVAVDLGSPRQKLFTILLPGIKDLPMVGSKRKGLNLEAIVAVEPDLVILYPYNDGPQIAEKLEMMGIAALIINPESLEEIREVNLLLGRALNLAEKAGEIDQTYRRILQIAAKIRGNQKEAKTVYFANSVLLDSVGEDMLQTAVIEKAGGKNPAADVKKGFVRSTPEQLVKWDPDVIVVSQLFSVQLEELFNDPRFQPVSAVNTGSVYRFPAEIDAWDFPGPSSYLGILWLAEKLYPDTFEIDLNREVEKFYRLLYGRGFSQLGGELQNKK